MKLETVKVWDTKERGHMLNQLADRYNELHNLEKTVKLIRKNVRSVLSEEHWEDLEQVLLGLDKLRDQKLLGVKHLVEAIDRNERDTAIYKPVETGLTAEERNKFRLN